MELYRGPALTVPLGQLLFAAALLLFAILGQLATKLRSEEAENWWASTGRDVVNFVGAAALSGAIWLLGFTLPLAIILGSTLALTLVVLRGFLLVRAARPWWGMLLGALLLAAPLIVIPAPLARGIGSLLSLLFPAADFGQ